MKTSVSLTLFLVGLLIGCGSRVLPVPGQRSAQTTDPPVITVTTAPEEEAELEDGAFILAGTIEADAGFATEYPLTLRVTDLETGLTSNYPIAENCLVIEADSEPLNSYFSPTTGVFLIDAEEDFTLDAGEKRLELIATDAEERTDTWDVTVTALQHWDFVTADGAAARADFDVQLRNAVQTYATLTAGLSFEAPYNFAGYDQAVLAVLDDYLEARIANESGSNFAEIGVDLEEAIDSIIDELKLPPEEEEFREEVYKAAGWERHIDDVLVDSLVYNQFCYGRDASLSHLTTTQAFYDHTFIQATSACYGGGIPLSGSDLYLLAEYEVRIFQDVGAPIGSVLLPENWDPENLEPETANPEHPIMLLHVEFRDGDLDELVDDIVVTGFEYNPDTEAEEELMGISDDYGHVITPLSHLWVSRYHYRGAI